MNKSLKAEISVVVVCSNKVKQKRSKNIFLFFFQAHFN